MLYEVITVKSQVFTDAEMARLVNVIQDGMSDSASLDNFMEFLRVNGVDFFKAARSLIPAPWHNASHMDSDLRAFYEYVSTNFDRITSYNVCYTKLLRSFHCANYPWRPDASCCR